MRSFAVRLTALTVLATATILPPDASAPDIPQPGTLQTELEVGDSSALQTGIVLPSDIQECLDIATADI